MNENCLEGKACPRCGQEDDIHLLVLTWMSLNDDGTDFYADSLKWMPEAEYDKDTHARCPYCGFAGKLEDFDQ